MLTRDNNNVMSVVKKLTYVNSSWDNRGKNVEVIGVKTKQKGVTIDRDNIVNFWVNMC